MERDEVLYRAVLTRDPRFDGRFFIGVKTTGVYCRPICPARPQRQNMVFFSSALAAERAGYRPCLRCRPESAPRSPVWIGTSAVVRRALRMISAHPDRHPDEEAFAEQFGLSARHLRRLFIQEIGRSPKSVADSLRLDFARTLIVETSLPMTEIALAAGFRSLRRFNDAVRLRFRRSPTEIRRSRTTVASDAGVVLNLSYRPPLDWQSLLRFYRVHGIPGLETVTADSYERVFTMDGCAGMFVATDDPAGHQIRLRVITRDSRCLFSVVRRVRTMFDLDADPVVIANGLAPSPLLARLVEQRPGLRMARGWDPFEIGVQTILGQLVTTGQARQLAGRLTQTYGERMRHPANGGVLRHFPSAVELAKARLTSLGTTRVKKQAIREFAQRVADRRISLAAEQDLESFREQLLEIHGIGPWSADYIAMCAMGDTDAYPAHDLILRRVTMLQPDLDLEPVRPWRGYAAIHLWTEFAASLSGVSWKSAQKKEE